MTDEKNEIEIVEADAMPIASAAPEVDVQITTAKRYPRSVKRFLDEAQSMACIDDATAASMAYALPRSGKTISGPSVRLAEIMASAWGNLRAETRIAGEDAKHVTGEAMCWDLEKNVAIRWQVKRRIVDKYGKRYNDDMIVVTGNAASAIAFRNAVFKIIPGSYVSKVLAAARKVAIGDAKNLSVTRDEAFACFRRFGITDDRILATLGKPSIEDVDIDDVATLRGFFTAIRDEGADVQEVFPPIETDEDKERKSKLKAKLAGGAKVNGNTGVAGAKREPKPEPEPADEAPPVTIVDQDNDEIDPVTGEILTEGDAGQVEAPEDAGEPANDGQMQLAPEPAPAAKPKTAKKKRRAAKADAPADETPADRMTEKQIEEQRQKLCSTYVDYCLALNIESGNISRMTNQTLEKKIAEMRAQSQGGE
jgi:hypothetical protein